MTTKRKTNAAKTPVKKNPDPIQMFAQGASGLLSALQIHSMLSKKKKPVRRKRTVNSAQRTVAKPRKSAVRTANPRPRVKSHGGTLYMLTVSRGDDTEAVYLHDGKSDGVNKRFATIGSAKAWATRNKKKVVENPSPAIKRKINGYRSWRLRRQAMKAYGQELKLEGRLEAVRKRKRRAAHKSKRRNPVTPVIAKAVNPRLDRHGRQTVNTLTCTKCKRQEQAASAATLERRADRDQWLVGTGRNGSKTLCRDCRFKRQKKNPATTARRRTYEMFQGRRVENVNRMDLSRHAGRGQKLDQLGKLIEVKLMDGTVYTPNPKKARLCAMRGRMWFVGERFERPDKTQPAHVLNPIGDIDHIVYETHKPHHGDKPETHYIHALGEEGGYLPLLCVDNEGFAVLKGGSYKIRREGIRD